MKENFWFGLTNADLMKMAEIAALTLLVCAVLLYVIRPCLSNITLNSKEGAGAWKDRWSTVGLATAVMVIGGILGTEVAPHLILTVSLVGLAVFVRMVVWPYLIRRHIRSYPREAVSDPIPWQQVGIVLVGFAICTIAIQLAPEDEREAWFLWLVRVVLHGTLLYILVTSVRNIIKQRDWKGNLFKVLVVVLAWAIIFP